jgi:hypothetical protein
MASLLTISADELAALRVERDAFQQQAHSLQQQAHSFQQQAQTLQQHADALQGELRVRTVERDLLREQLKSFQRKLFAARSEARGSEQSSLISAPISTSAMPSWGQKRSASGSSCRTMSRGSAGASGLRPRLLRLCGAT